MAQLIVKILTRFDLSIFDLGWHCWKLVDSSDLRTHGQTTALNRVHLVENGRLEEANFQEPTVVSAVYLSVSLFRSIF